MRQTPQFSTWTAILLAALMSVASCERTGPTEPTVPEGFASIGIAANVSGTTVAELVVEVTAADLPQALVFNLPVKDGMASGTITVPAGSDRTIRVNALDAKRIETHRGEATIDVFAGENPRLSIRLLPLEGTIEIDVIIGEGSGESGSEGIKVLSHNVYMLPFPLSPGRVQRAARIAGSDYIKGYDIVLLDELFDTRASGIVLDGLSTEYSHQTPVIGRFDETNSSCAENICWNRTEGDYRSATPEDGGVAIISKWPIEERAQYIFPPGCGADRQSNKGFAYAKVNKDGTIFHVIATHVQAVDAACVSRFTDVIEGDVVRLQQFDSITAWIDRQDFPADETVLIGGDLNVDIERAEGAEYQKMLDALVVKSPIYGDGGQFTYNPRNNDLTASGRFPNGNGVHLSAEPYKLDYIFVRSDHAQPSGWTNFTMYPSLWPNTWVGDGRESDEYSDHYPVVGFSDDVANPPPPFPDRVPRYSRLQFRSRLNNNYIRRQNNTDGWLIANGGKRDGQGNRNEQTVFELEPWQSTLRDAFDPYCLTSGSFVRIRSVRNNTSWYWNWFGGVPGRYGYFMRNNNPSDNLYIEIRSRNGTGCLRDGDSVALGDKRGLSWRFMRQWPAPDCSTILGVEFCDPDWENYLFLSSTRVGVRESFWVELK